jgi:hypothetical protein
LTEDQRRKLSESFNKLLELTPTEKVKALRTLSDAERRQMEKTLLAFEKLPQDRRDRCVRSFATFATLSAAEQQEFLKNAERWSQMSPAERQTWNELVSLAPSFAPLPSLLTETATVSTRAFSSNATNGTDLVRREAIDGVKAAGVPASMFHQGNIFKLSIRACVLRFSGCIRLPSTSAR